MDKTNAIIKSKGSHFENYANDPTSAPNRHVSQSAVEPQNFSSPSGMKLWRYGDHGGTMNRTYPEDGHTLSRQYTGTPKSPTPGYLTHQQFTLNYNYSYLGIQPHLNASNLVQPVLSPQEARILSDQKDKVILENSPANHSQIAYTLAADPETVQLNSDTSSAESFLTMPETACDKDMMRLSTESIQDIPGGTASAIAVTKHSVDKSINVCGSSSLDKQRKEVCTCKAIPTFDGKLSDSINLYTCGGCGKLFGTVCELHKHLLGHDTGGSYKYNHNLRTAYPTFDTVCAGTQSGVQEDMERVVESATESMNVSVSPNEMVESKGHEDKDPEKSFPDEKIKTEIDEHLTKSISTVQVDDDSDTDVMDEANMENTIKIEIDIVKHSEEMTGTGIQTKQEEGKGHKKKASNKTQRSSKCKKLVSKIRQKSTKKKPNQETLYEVVREKHNTSVKAKITRKGRNARTNKLKKKYACDICGKSYVKEENLAQHKEKTHTTKEPKSQKLHSCKWCGQTFERRKCLFEHSKLCNKNESFRCFICDTVHPSKEWLLEHLVVHRNEKDLTCKECMREFPNEITMQYHAKRHKLPKDIQCDKCGKAFYHQNMLNKHLVHCNDERSFECQQCQLRFKTRDALKHHSSVHNEDRPYMCHICGYAVKKQMYLTRHIRSHTGERPYPCKTCGMRFSALNGLNRHHKTHTNEKMCICSYCGKGFTNNWNLKTHERQHTGDTPYKCPHCEIGFKQNVLVKLHIKSHHPYLSQISTEKSVTEHL